MTPELARGMRQILYTLVLVAFLKSCTPYLTEPEMDGAELPAIAVSVTPKVQMVGYGQSGRVRVKITVPKNALNRAVCVAVDGPTYRSSCFEHVGLGAPSVAEWVFSGLEPGWYEAVATLERAKEGESGRDYKIGRDQFQVAGGASDF
jgi:hypothetical protein